MALVLLLQRAVVLASEGFELLPVAGPQILEFLFMGVLEYMHSPLDFRIDRLAAIRCRVDRVVVLGWSAAKRPGAFASV